MPQNRGTAPAVPRTRRGIGIVESLAGMYRIVRTMFSTCCGVSLIEAHGAVFHVEVHEVDVGVSRQ